MLLEVLLLDHATSNPRSAATEWRRLIRVIVTAGMDHDRVIGKIRDLETRCKNRVRRLAGRVDIQWRQITQMTIAPGFAVLVGARRVQVTAGRDRSAQLAVLLSGGAARILMDMKAMETRWQAHQRRRQHQTVL